MAGCLDGEDRLEIGVSNDGERRGSIVTDPLDLQTDAGR